MRAASSTRDDARAGSIIRRLTLFTADRNSFEIALNWPTVGHSKAKGEDPTVRPSTNSVVRGQWKARDTGKHIPKYKV